MLGDLDVSLFLMILEKQEYCSYTKNHPCSDTKENSTKKTRKLKIIASNIIFTLTLAF